MRKIISSMLCILFVFALSSCGLFSGPDTNTVFVKNDGTIIGTLVETFDKKYYDKKELENYIKDQINDYENSAGKNTVKLKSFKVKEKKAKVEIQYETAKDYKEFNHINFFAGTIKKALEAGYAFDKEFLEVVNGEIGEAVNTEQIKEDEKLKVIITEEIGDIKTSGDIIFVGSIHAKIKAKDVVSIKKVKDSNEEPDEEKMLTYIIYK
ncbi:LptM family lipoprotein [Anaerosacchariphilus polymeriproducens]|uniref:Lipoprotein n=1 Tax=Anaerosacchariphilus polymeriproducens TaxID=1812858 RepID=A0A371AZD2_9FIRM|nr:hypothetical protein [Anaerosacchariphilus polymeriproducens]RDU24840.1 hypothetical protein DWV06_02360 [Anaerosacchariphilus polymeriproducens]